MHTSIRGEYTAMAGLDPTAMMCTLGSRSDEGERGEALHTPIPLLSHARRGFGRCSVPQTTMS